MKSRRGRVVSSSDLALCLASMGLCRVLRVLHPRRLPVVVLGTKSQVRLLSILLARLVKVANAHGKSVSELGAPQRRQVAHVDTKDVWSTRKRLCGRSCGWSL